MPVSTKVFADQMLTRFSRVNEEIELRQTKIATGQNITRASEKPNDAIRLSALEERVTQLEGYQRNVGVAQDRLSAGDDALLAVDNVLSRIREISIAVNSDTFDSNDRQAYSVEIRGLRESLLGLANSRTTDGQALFGGYATDIMPFVENEHGRVEYRGDAGEHTLAASESMRLPTSVNGAAVFMQVQTENGRVSIFDIVDSLEAALLTSSSTQTTLSSSGTEGLSLSFNGDRVPRDMSFTISGPGGQVRITAEGVVGGSAERIADAINEQTTNTGVTAAVDGGRVTLSTDTGEISISALEIEGVTAAQRQIKFSITTDDTPPKTLAPIAQSINAQLSAIKAAGDDIAISRTTVGARLQRANEQEEALATRSISLQERVNDLSAADLERVITELQTLLLTRDAARQAFTQISRTSLFDYLK
jgi:flagellar hook-associated protein 3 FlgL